MRTSPAPRSGLLGQFRHQFFLLALIPHFHKAALLMLSDRLVTALNRLQIGNAESVKTFKRDIREVLEVFLRFTHRYWFNEISDQAQARALFAMTRGHLGTERLYAELREEIQDMSQYLDSDSLRRQANTVVRLTVVTTAGLIATISTGFLGMNLIDAAQEPLPERLSSSRWSSCFRPCSPVSRSSGRNGCRIFSRHCPTSACRRATSWRRCSPSGATGDRRATAERRRRNRPSGPCRRQERETVVPRWCFPAAEGVDCRS
jgi:hypothetical protein